MTSWDCTCGHTVFWKDRCPNCGKSIKEGGLDLLVICLPQIKKKGKENG